MHLSYEYAAYAETEEEAQAKALSDFERDCRENPDQTSDPEIDSIEEATEYKGLCDCCGEHLTETSKINDYLCKACDGH